MLLNYPFLMFKCVHTAYYFDENIFIRFGRKHTINIDPDDNTRKHFKTYNM